MIDNTFHRFTVQNTGVLVITHADTDTAAELARELLAAGHRLVVTAQTPASLSRILLGQPADRVIAVAADLEDPIQVERLLQRARARLGVVTHVIDGSTGSTGWARYALGCAS